MDDIARRIAALSEKKRALLEVELEKIRSRRSVIDRIPRRAGGEAVPLSFSQQRLWFLDQLEPHSSLYNIAGALRLKGVLDAAVLERSLNEIARRHETLRTTFPILEGEPVQTVAPPVALSLPIIDLGPVAAVERDAELQRRLDAETRRWNPCRKRRRNATSERTRRKSGGGAMMASSAYRTTR